MIFFPKIFFRKKRKQKPQQKINLISTKPLFYIENQRQFNQFLSKIKKSGNLIAIDTEFVRKTTYYPILSLIQVADDNGNIYLIDCLQNINIKAFRSILTNEKITKIIHSSLQDLQIFYRLFSLNAKSIKNIADTQIMANILGIGFNIGYGNLVAQILQKEINKNEQNSNWQRRPLSAKQIEYASIDVLHLREIYLILQSQITILKRQSWFAEEMKNHLNNILHDNESDLFKRFSFARKSPQHIAMMKKLIIWRDKTAKKLNIVRRHLISDESLEKMALDRKCYAKLDDKLKKQITKILNSKIKLKELSGQKREYIMSLEKQQVFQKTKSVIHEISNEIHVSPQFLLTTKSLKSLILNNEKFDLVIKGWRLEVIGKEIKPYTEEIYKNPKI